MTLGRDVPSRAGLEEILLCRRGQCLAVHPRSRPDPQRNLASGRQRPVDTNTCASNSMHAGRRLSAFDRGGTISLEGTGSHAMPTVAVNGAGLYYEVRGTGPTVLLIMGATGESARRLVPNGFNPTWSPDDKEITYDISPVIQPYGRVSLGSLWRVSVSSGQTRMAEEQDAVQAARDEVKKRPASTAC